MPLKIPTDEVRIEIGPAGWDFPAEGPAWQGWPLGEVVTVTAPEDRIANALERIAAALERTMPED